VTSRRARARAKKREEAAAAARPRYNVKLAVRTLAGGEKVRHALGELERTRCGRGTVGASLERGEPDCVQCLALLDLDQLGDRS